METFDPSQCLNPVISKDPNNNSPSLLKGYSLRPRAARKCEDEDASAEPEAWRPPRNKRKQKSMPLSKYRRKTANARERSRMKEINDAFEALRRVIPQMSARDCNGEKLTKITTLRLAMKYISALDSALHDQDVESDGESLLSDYTLTSPELFSNSPASHSLASDLFPPLLSDAPLDHSLPTLAVPDFTNSSYVFEDTLFLSDFS